MHMHKYVHNDIGAKIKKKIKTFQIFIFKMFAAPSFLLLHCTYYICLPVMDVSKLLMVTRHFPYIPDVLSNLFLYTSLHVYNSSHNLFWCPLSLSVSLVLISHICLCSLIHSFTEVKLGTRSIYLFTKVGYQPANKPCY